MLLSDTEGDSNEDDDPEVEISDVRCVHAYIFILYVNGLSQCYC